MSKKVFIVGEVLFLLFIVICIGLIYIVHKYFGKYEFYFLGVIMSYNTILIKKDENLNFNLSLYNIIKYYCLSIYHYYKEIYRK